MGKKKKKDKPSFDEFYEELFPKRWTAIRRSLLEEGTYTELSKNLHKTYYLDEASYYTALLLDAAEEDEVLDMCAAPGGKTLVLASHFPRIRLTANEKSGKRRDRLRRVLYTHLGEEKAKKVRIRGLDATLWYRYEQERYDRILLDVPCSSERHIINSSKDLAKWSPARSTHLSIQAFAMLASALEALKVGGICIYSTCSLSPLENDDVLAKLERKREGRADLPPVHLPFGEQTRYGWHVLPDSAGGRGPMYVAKIKRIQ